MRARGREMYLRADLDGGDGLNKQNTLYKYITIHSIIMITNGGQTSIRVRVRVMDLRAILDEGAAGNTWGIVKAHLFKSVRKGALSHALE